METAMLEWVLSELNRTKKLPVRELPEAYPIPFSPDRQTSRYFLRGSDRYRPRTLYLPRPPTVVCSG